jgi:hypothetical protein
MLLSRRWARGVYPPPGEEKRQLVRSADPAVLVKLDPKSGIDIEKLLLQRQIPAGGGTKSPEGAVEVLDRFACTA